MRYPLNTLGLSHQFIAANVKEGAFVIDATAGKGRDTLFLSRLVGDTGRVLAFDIQKDAVDQTRSLLAENGCTNCEVFLESHEKMAEHAQKESVDAIMFNLGWLPGGDHHVFSKPESTIRAIESGLSLLKAGGVMTICIYHGRETGTAEKDALLPYLKTIDNKRFTVMTVDFTNRTGEIPIPVMIVKERA